MVCLKKVISEACISSNKYSVDFLPDPTRTTEESRGQKSTNGTLVANCIPNDPKVDPEKTVRIVPQLITVLKTEVRSA